MYEGLQFLTFNACHIETDVFSGDNADLFLISFSEIEMSSLLKENSIHFKITQFPK